MLNWLVIGVGDITTRRVIPAILDEPRSTLYGIVTRTPDKARPYTEHVWSDLAKALADPAVDVVYVGTPVALHAPQSIAALQAGKHVLCEKPMAMNYLEATSMVEAGQASGRIFGVSYYRRLYPKVQRTQQLLDGGVIGRPVLAEANCHSELPDPARGWLLDPVMAGGGPLYDIASHRIDLFNFWFGEPVRVTAQLSKAVHHTAVEDNATVLIEYADGVRGIIDVRWHSKVFRDQCRMVGTDGEINLSPLGEPELTYPGGCEHLPVHENLHFPCIQNFVSAVLEGERLVSSAETAIWTDWVTAEAVKQNACSGQTQPRTYIETGTRP